MKTSRFRDPVYIGDPINAIKIFNEKGADELVFLDISATADNRPPDLEIIEKIASECFMPVCYGGGVREIDDVKRIFKLGIEKVSIGCHAIENPEFVKELVMYFGGQSVVVCLDVKKNFFGNYKIVTRNAGRSTGEDPLSTAQEMARLGVGELIINSVDRDGMMTGYDINLMRKITKSVDIPVIACGGAGNLEHISEVINVGGASSAAAGSLFVFCGKRRGVLVNYPTRVEMDLLFK